MDPWAEYLAQRRLHRPDGEGGTTAGPRDLRAGHQGEASQRQPPGAAFDVLGWRVPFGTLPTPSGNGPTAPPQFGQPDFLGSGIRPSGVGPHPVLATGAPPRGMTSTSWPTSSQFPWQLPQGSSFPVGPGVADSAEGLRAPGSFSARPMAFAPTPRPAASTTSPLDPRAYEPRMNAATASRSLDEVPPLSSSSATKVTSAFDVLGVPAPKGARNPPDQGERFIQAITGERKAIPGWNGQPVTLRSWLKLLAIWETETTLARDKWGLRLYQSFPEGSQPRKIADQIPMTELLKESGYDKVLTVLMQKYRPYLEVAGPAAVDKFFYTGERGKGETFATYIATKEVLRQDLESHLSEALNDKVAGRILLRHANLSEFQREMISLRDQASLMGFDQVASMLRPLDRPELLAQAAGAELGQAASKHFPTTTVHDDGYSNAYFTGDGQTEPSGEEHQDEPEEEEESEELGEDELYMEDREYDEDEATYLQAYHSAYADVRKDLRDRRRERGFVKHNKASPSRSPSTRGRGRGKPRTSVGRGSSTKFGGKGANKMFRGTSEDLQSRTRCFNCDQLGHFARDCPLKGGGKGAASPKRVNFVISRGSSTMSSVWMALRTSWPKITPAMREYENGMLRHVAVFAGVRVKNTEALVDTAAEDAVIGENAMNAMKEALKGFGLCTVSVAMEGQAPCAGIGGEGKLIALEDVPVAVAGIHGLLRFNVLQDNVFSTPPLLPISFLEAIGAIIDLPGNQLRTPDGFHAPMVRLPSGHRSIDIFDFRQRPWQLPEEHRVQGRDPFQLSTPHVLASAKGPSDTSRAATCEDLPFSEMPDLTSLTPHNPQVHVFVQQGPGEEREPRDLRYVTTLRGWRTALVCPSDIPQLRPWTLDKQRSTIAVDPHGHVQRVLDVWNSPHASRDLTRRWQGIVTFYLTESSRTTTSGSGDPVPAPEDEPDCGPGGPGGSCANPSATTSSTSATTTGQKTALTSATTATTRSASSAKAWLILQDATKVECRARELRESRKFSFADLEELLLSLETPRGGLGTPKQILEAAGNSGNHPFSLVLGAFAYGAQYGYTKNTEKYPEMTQYLNAWFTHHVPTASFTSISVASNMKAALHRDVNNTSSSVNITTAVGKFTGGSLWIEQKSPSVSVDCPGRGRLVSRKTPHGLWLSGKLHPTRHRVVTFSPKLWHGVQGWQGKRVSVTAYTIRNLEALSESDQHQLMCWGFPIRAGDRQALSTCLPIMISEEAAPEEIDQQCEFDFEGVFNAPLCDPGLNRMPDSVDSMFKRMSKWMWCNKRKPKALLPDPSTHVASGPRREADRPGEHLQPAEFVIGSPFAKNGKSQVRIGVETTRHSTSGDSQHRATADGGGLVCGDGEPAGGQEQSGLSQGQSNGQEAQERADRPRNWEASVEVQGTKVVRQGAGTVQPPPGQAEVPCQLSQSVVDMHELRKPLGENQVGGGNREQASGHIRDSSQTQRSLWAGISSIPSGSEGQANAGRQGRDAGCSRKAASNGFDNNNVLDSFDCFYFRADREHQGDLSGHSDNAQEIVGPKGETKVQDTQSRNRELRDWQRRWTLGRSGDEGSGELKRSAPRAPKILVEHEHLEKARAGRFQKLAGWLQAKGWAMKTMLILVTLIQPGWRQDYPQLSRRSQQRDRLGWSEKLLVGIGSGHGCRGIHRMPDLRSKDQKMQLVAR